MNSYTIEVTDTFGGQANYSWIRRHKITAKSRHAALCRLAKIEGLSFRANVTGRHHDAIRYDAQGACICAFLRAA